MLTVVIPTLNRSAILARALAHLDRQEGAAGAFDVIVVADARDVQSATLDVAPGAHPYALTLLHAETAGASAARNAGWRAAAGSVVLFIGDDILASPRLVAEHTAWHERNPDDAAAVLGKVEWARELRRTPFMRWLDRGWQFDYDAIAGDDAGWGRFYTANVSVKRALLERSGGFDEDFPFLGEDIELGRRLNDLGLRLLYNRAAVAEHLHQPTLDEWRERMALVAAAERRLGAKHPDVAPHFLPRFQAAMAEPSPRGVGARIARWVPEGTPWLGARVWGSVDARYTRELAPSFLQAWADADPGVPVGRP